MKKDEAEAVTWYRKAAEQGHLYAQNSLGLVDDHGQLVKKTDAEKGVELLRKAAEQEDAAAQFNTGNDYHFGQLMKKNEAEAVKWYRKAAEQGYAAAQGNLGVCYGNGQGVKKSEKEAAKWYRKAAEQGNAAAQYNLGNSYVFGWGVQKDEVEAVKWYRKAAEQGDAMAQGNLGVCYSNGDGVIKSDIESYKWSLLAAAQGNEIAKKNLVVDERRLLPAQRAEGQRLAQEWDVNFKRAKNKESEAKPMAEAATLDEPKVTGTGFFITPNGYLVTNHHVVKDAQKVRLQSAAGLLDAEVVRVDAASDLALLKVTGEFAPLPVISSRTVRLGASVATVGFPNTGLQGYEPKLSRGDISSLAGIQDDVKGFQISVPIQPGNSGGALVDERGNVVGIVNGQLSQKAALANSGALAQNVNYAVKSSYLLSFLEAAPEVSEGMLEAKTEDKKFELVVDDVRKATVLIICY